MRAHWVKTDNASVPDKVFLRRKATEHLGSLRVLDLYAGENVLYGHFDTERYYGVEIVGDKGKNLHGDCKRVIASLDLSDINVIDCDSYGIPFDIILKIFENPTLQKGTVIIYTAIANRMSGVSRRCLEMFGLERIWAKNHTLIAGKAHELFYAMLEKNGVSMVHYYKVSAGFQKHYGYFVV